MLLSQDKLSARPEAEAREEVESFRVALWLRLSQRMTNRTNVPQFLSIA
jgi:hypothetical protein